MASPHEFGRRCEQLAVAHLTASGWHIVARNFRFGRREIDVIARRDNLIIFVEVKGRRGRGCGHPLEAIHPRKRREIQRVALHWVSRFGSPGLMYRFDAISVVGTADPPDIAHVEDAWRL